MFVNGSSFHNAMNSLLLNVLIESMFNIVCSWRGACTRFFNLVHSIFQIEMTKFNSFNSLKQKRNFKVFNQDLIHVQWFHFDFSNVVQISNYKLDYVVSMCNNLHISRNIILLPTMAQTSRIHASISILN